MGDEEKEMQPQKQEAAEAKPAAAGETLSDDEFAELLSEKFGKFEDLAKILPSFKNCLFELEI